jgi:7-cyano-7-deazaguanine reductase
MSKNPLGETTGYPSTYSPDLLFAVPRIDARQAVAIGTGKELPFSGLDLWNAWELSWLDSDGKPVAATAEIRVPVESPCIIESKSLKLYLNSLAMTRYPDEHSLADVIQGDLSAIAGENVQVAILPACAWQDQQFAQLPGRCIDSHPARVSTDGVDAVLLTTHGDPVPLQELYSHLLYSNCPVTNQPDSGSILIRYSGPKIDEEGLLNYLVSYRQHNDFHEACVERIFVDINHRCGPDKLTVYARYNRRGGLDINPFRSNFETAPENTRLWRQ